MTKVLKALKVIQAVSTAVQWAWNLSMWACPITWIVLGIIALVAVFVILWVKCAWFRNFWIGLWNVIKSAALAVARWFMATVVPFFKAVWSGIVVGAKWLAKILGVVWTFILNGIRGWLLIARAVLGFFAPIFKAAFGVVIAIVEVTWAIITAAFAVFNAIVLRPMIAGFKALWSLVVIAHRGMMIAVTAVWGVIGPYVIGAAKAIWAYLTFMWTAVWRLTVLVSSAIWGAVQFAWNAIWGYIKFVAGGIWAFLQRTWSLIHSGAEVAWNGFKALISGVWHAVANFVKNGVDKVKDALNGIKAILDKVKGFFNQLKDAANGGVLSLIAFVATVPGRIIGALGDLGAKLFNSGRALLQGFIDGVKDRIHDLVETVKGGLSKVSNLFPHSPAPVLGQGMDALFGAGAS